MLDGGLSAETIAFTFGLDASTIYRYAENYQQSSSVSEYLSVAYAGSSSNLSKEECEGLSEELRKQLYRSGKEIAGWIRGTYGVEYSANGAIGLVKRLGFVYKKTRLYSEKSDSEAQLRFVEGLEGLIEGLVPEDSVYFGDAVHPQHTTRLSYG